eukprot:TRINITY_DN12092_c0_g1_i1.p1 TRINITY_DN12092_c0_g1~~TRINITY_DN12092_c0_g1_i1.p1  ORF type:complete len:909 (+),score=232.94 TRINITY_DN12092_c0_g1_i1:71-2728(+)
MAAREPVPPTETSWDQHDPKRARQIGVRIDRTGAYFVALATIVSIYADLAVACYHAVVEFKGWGHAALACWAVSSVLLCIWSVADAEGQLLWVPKCCRELYGGRAEAARHRVSVSDGAGRTLLTFLQLRMVFEAWRYCSKLAHAHRVDVEDGLSVHTSARWRVVTQQAQMYFLKWQRVHALVVHPPQVLLLAYIQVSLDQYTWFGLAPIMLSIFVMSFAFTSTGCEPFGVRWLTFCKDFLFHVSHLVGHLMCNALFAACHRTWVLLVIGCNAGLNAVLLFRGCRLPLVSERTSLEPCERTLTRMLLTCVGRLVYIDVGRMHVHVWCPVTAPFLREEGERINYYIYWKNWLISLALLVPVFLRKDSSISPDVCPFYEERIAQPWEPASWEKKFWGTVGTALLNMACFLWCLNDDHDRRQGWMVLIVNPLQGDMWEPRGADHDSDEMLSQQSGSVDYTSLSLDCTARSALLPQPERDTPQEPMDSPGATHFSSGSARRGSRQPSPAAELPRCLSGRCGGADAMLRAPRPGRRRQSLGAAPAGQTLAGLGLQFAPMPREGAPRHVAAAADRSSSGAPLLRGVRRGSAAHRQGFARFIGARLTHVCGVPVPALLAEAADCDDHESSAAGSAARVSVGHATLPEHGGELCLSFDAPPLEPGDPVQLLAASGFHWVPGAVSVLAKRGREVVVRFLHDYDSVFPASACPAVRRCPPRAAAVDAESTLGCLPPPGDILTPELHQAANMTFDTEPTPFTGTFRFPAASRELQASAAVQPADSLESTREQRRGSVRSASTAKAQLAYSDGGSADGARAPSHGRIPPAEADPLGCPPPAAAPPVAAVTSDHSPPRTEPAASNHPSEQDTLPALDDDGASLPALTLGTGAPTDAAPD